MIKPEKAAELLEKATGGGVCPQCRGENKYSITCLCGGDGTAKAFYEEKLKQISIEMAETIIKQGEDNQRLRELAESVVFSMSHDSALYKQAQKALQETAKELLEKATGMHAAGCNAYNTTADPRGTVCNCAVGEAQMELAMKGEEMAETIIKQGELITKLKDELYCENCNHELLKGYEPSFRKEIESNG